MHEEIARYESLLDSLERGRDGNLTRTTLAALRTRDAIIPLLGSTPLTPELLSAIQGLDDRLRAHAPTIVAAIGRSTLKSWRAAVSAPASSWWWSLDVVADEAIPAPHPLWAIVSAAMLTLAISLATDISLRFLSGGADLLGLLSTFSQAFLALLAGSAFTRVGGGWVDRFLARRRIAASSYGAVKTSFALATLAVIMGLRLSLPSVAREYNDYGVVLQQDGKITRARLAFERAVRLDPDAPQPHFNLASALEETLDYDAALSEYQRTIKLDERMYPAYNNLARLYMLRRSDFASALQLLDDAMALAPTDSRIQYSLLKNRGWANLRLNYLQQAEADLRAALQLRPDGGAAAHCLLAQLLEAKQLDAAVEWEACIAYADGERHELEASWLGLAQERAQEAK